MTNAAACRAPIAMPNGTTTKALTDRLHARTGQLGAGLIHRRWRLRAYNVGRDRRL